MIDLNSDNDPLLFRAELPVGVIIVQFHEIIAAIGRKDDYEIADVTAAMRKVARTPETAAAASDEQLFGLFIRIKNAAERSGN
jgi:hypothetical protein